MINQNFLFRSVSNSQLIFFRIVWGLLMFGEAVGAMVTDYVDDVYVKPKMLFTFFGFEFLQFFIGEWMYIYFTVMTILGLMIAFGIKYRLSSLLFAILWFGSYITHKIHYNNHHYLIMLISWLMVFVPAESYLSLDSRRTGISTRQMPQWVRVLFISQLLIVYVYASIAKIYPDWLSGEAVEALLYSKTDNILIGEFARNKTLHLIMAYSGIAFDLVVIPFLIWKRTRLITFIASLFFHMINLVVFEIGVFPFLALALDIFFLAPELIDKYIFKLKEKPTPETSFKTRKAFTYLLAFYLLLQVALPVRHWFIPGDVLCTEEGHRLSWRMMLRTKSGRLRFIVKNENGEFMKLINPVEYFTKRQGLSMIGRPDMIWAGAQEIAKNFEEEYGKSVHVYASSYVRINRSKKKHKFIDPFVDLASVDWNTFTHNEWIICECDE